MTAAFDSHVHTAFSADSEMAAAEAFTAAGGRGLVFTEHVDYGLDIPGFDFVCDVPAYLAAYGKFRGDNLHLGLEVGLAAEAAQRNAELAANPLLDYIIGSVHMIDGRDLTLLYQDHMAPEEVAGRYLRATLEMVERNSFFDALGHIDYPSRYSPHPDPEIWYDDFPGLYDSIFRALTERGKLLELNTVRVLCRPAYKNLARLYARYRELGGRFVTMGSDAHMAAALFRGFEQGRRLARECGLRVVHFREREPVAEDL